MRRSCALEVCQFALLFYVSAHALISSCPTRAIPIDNQDRDRQSNFIRVSFDLGVDKLLRTTVSPVYLPKVRRSIHESNGRVLLPEQVIICGACLDARATIHPVVGLNADMPARCRDAKRPYGESRDTALHASKNNFQAINVVAVSRKSGWDIVPTSFDGYSEWLERHFLESVGYRSHAAAILGRFPHKVVNIKPIRMRVGEQPGSTEENVTRLLDFTHRRMSVPARGFDIHAAVRSKDYESLGLYGNDSRGATLAGTQEDQQSENGWSPKYMRFGSLGPTHGWEDAKTGFQIYDLSDCDIDVSNDGKHWLHFAGAHCLSNLASCKTLVPQGPGNNQ
jgi:hypothetical protein